MLILPIKKKWYDMIASGEKKEEYREIKPYWTKRIENDYNATKFINKKLLLGFIDMLVFSSYTTTIILQNGYKKDNPKLKCKCKIKIGQGKEEWGAEKRKRVLYFRNFGGSK